MKIGNSVDTPLGHGKIIQKEERKRYCVKLESCPDDLLYLQNKYGGLYFWKDEIKIIDE